MYMDINQVCAQDGWMLAKFFFFFSCLWTKMDVWALMNLPRFWRKSPEVHHQKFE